MLEFVSAMREDKTLLLDFCGESPLLALMQGDAERRSKRLGDRRAAGEWLPALKRLLQAEGWQLRDLDAIGVVAGPGSFTGVRTAVAAGKGLSEAGSVKLVLVSRLAVMTMAAAEEDALTMLFAGRDQVYLRVPALGEDAAMESLLSHEEVAGLAQGRSVNVAEQRLVELFPGLDIKLIEITPESILRVVREVLGGGQIDAAAADANYVRNEGEIYRKLGVKNPDNIGAGKSDVVLPPSA